MKTRGAIGTRARPAFDRPALIVLDFDGVLTTNQVIVFDDGREATVGNRADGLAFDALRRAGIPVLILSTERNAVVAARARKLRVPFVHGTTCKVTAAQEYCGGLGISLSDVLYVGNDVNDLDVMRRVGFTACPADAHHAIKQAAHHVLKAKGGEGVVRELAEVLLAIDCLPPLARESYEL